VTSLTNSSGTAAQTYTYDSFGNVTASSGSLTNPFQYTGRELDPETGLYYYRARYYDAHAGRFMSEDASGFSAGINFYRYVHNRPSVLVDPSGQVDVIHNEGIVVEPNVDADCRDAANPKNETAGGCNKVNYLPPIPARRNHAQATL
jgi:RHS repeat-associated protein